MMVPAEDAQDHLGNTMEEMMSGGLGMTDDNNMTNGDNGMITGDTDIMPGASDMMENDTGTMSSGNGMMG